MKQRWRDAAETAASCESKIATFVIAVIMLLLVGVLAKVRLHFKTAAASITALSTATAHGVAIVHRWMVCKLNWTQRWMLCKLSWTVSVSAMQVCNEPQRWD